MMKHTSRLASRQTNISSVVCESSQNSYSPMETSCSQPTQDLKRIVLKLLIGGGCVLLSLTLFLVTLRLKQQTNSSSDSPADDSGLKDSGLIIDFGGGMTKNTIGEDQPTITTAEFMAYLYNYSENSQLMYRIVNQRSFDTDFFKDTDDPKVIVILSPLDDRDIGRCTNIPTKFQNQRCDFTFNVSRIEEADAVVVREKDLSINSLPKRNNSKQVWIYNTLTPNNQKILNTANLKVVFNISGTYDTRSHLPILPMYWIPRNGSTLNKRTYMKKIDTDETQVKVVVYNKDCEEEDIFLQKHRSKIQELESGEDVVIEWYGNCNKSANWKGDCVNMTSAQCYEKIAAKSKFALAFEVYDDYISERFFDPLNNTIIPLVLGSSSMLTKYQVLAPQGSFIYEPNFEMSKLKELLKQLNTKEESLKEYFTWLIEKKGEFKSYYRWYCQVCASLYRAVNVTSSIDISQWR